ncbi:MAG: hypothetical protein LH614_16020 [Pyrinomonadaceae bacterium]|nr:hypothetical protein [Pyrinomonadaceae bacterium]
MENQPTDIKKTPTAAIAFAWLLVSVPLLWGGFQTLAKTVALFQYNN